MSSSILVVEDEPAILELISINLKQAGHSVMAAANAEQAKQLLKESLPDLVLIDWMLPGMNGVEFVRHLRAVPHTQTLPIIMLTARREEQDKLAGLEVGADDYITKPFSPRELIARIKAVLRRRTPSLVKEDIEINGLILDTVAHRLSFKNQAVEIGPTEFRLLHFLMTHPDRVYSRTQLLDQVWGNNVFLEERTVDVHIRRLRSALSETGLQGLVQTVRGVGYRFSEQ